MSDLIINNRGSGLLGDHQKNHSDIIQAAHFQDGKHTISYDLFIRRFNFREVLPEGRNVTGCNNEETSRPSGCTSGTRQWATQLVRLIRVRCTSEMDLCVGVPSLGTRITLVGIILFLQSSPCSVWLDPCCRRKWYWLTQSLLNDWLTRNRGSASARTWLTLKLGYRYRIRDGWL